MGARIKPQPVHWTDEELFDALHAWVEKHGRVPSAATDWKRGGYGHPAARTCFTRFGSWSAFIRAAGYEPRRAGSPGAVGPLPPVITETGISVYWTRERIVEWLLDELLLTGRWPGARELRRANTTGRRRPAYATIRNVFGSYMAAKKAAGWDTSCASCRSKFKPIRHSQRFCSNRCSKRGPAPLPEEPKCSGCGTELENTTLGCKPCWERMRERGRRTDPSYRENQAAARRERHRAAKCGPPASPARGETGVPVGATTLPERKAA